MDNTVGRIKARIPIECRQPKLSELPKRGTQMIIRITPENQSEGYDSEHIAQGAADIAEIVRMFIKHGLFKGPIGPALMIDIRGIKNVADARVIIAAMLANFNADAYGHARCLKQLVMGDDGDEIVVQLMMAYTAEAEAEMDKVGGVIGGSCGDIGVLIKKIMDGEY